MPPRAVKTIKDLIFYQYAKIIASSAKYSFNNPISSLKLFQLKVRSVPSRRQGYGGQAG